MWYVQISFLCMDGYVISINIGSLSVSIWMWFFLSMLLALPLMNAFASDVSSNYLG